MAYATADDWLKAEHSQSYIGDLDGDGETDIAAVDHALDAASEEMNGWLASRYTIPVRHEGALRVLKVHCIAIGTYHMARTANQVSEQIETRYKSSIDYLKAIGAGKADLPMPVASSSGGEAGSTSPASSADVQFTSSEKLFSRDSLKDW
ncbi:putative protein gp36 [Roseibium sp. TrichSKD4]|uniref:gp436 family protein n=1 Tax=Roseibium sp. TrichSKD4 TaxID=744980 RepID=UPI0001E57603|nr:phage protein Gp36 family protein [Roseibium sp. TrichSKD4]EFO30938.1 putative protein gp36 [Roseibium sp. TrichSKD4]